MLYRVIGIMSGSPSLDGLDIAFMLVKKSGGENGLMKLRLGCKHLQP